MSDRGTGGQGVPPGAPWNGQPSQPHGAPGQVPPGPGQQPSAQQPVQQQPVQQQPVQQQPVQQQPVQQQPVQQQPVPQPYADPASAGQGAPPPPQPIPADQAVEVTPPEAFQDATWDDVNRVRDREREAGYGPGEAPDIVYEQHDGPTVIDTAAGSGDGIRKCPSCGSSDIQLDIPSGMLVCHFCRHAWSTPLATEAFHLDTPIGDLRGRVIGSGSQNIVPGTDQVVSFKCAACGAEISIDTNHAMQARCPWCRNTLSINEQMPNGAVPDVVLPFSLPKDAAVERIGAFVKKRRFFANRRFIREFSPENVLGVYLPYMIVDVNANLTFEGEGEHTTRTYTVSVGKDETERRFDYDVYRVGRRFSLHVDDLTLESASDKRDQDASRNTNNIINSIMPFDTKNAVVYDANYLAGFSSQRRDVDVDALYEPAAMQTEDIGRYRSLDTISFYDRGVRWDRRDVEIMGERWIAAYLPVWLYSYQEEKSGGRKLLHYIAVNGRTGETMGSVPLNMTRLWVFTGIAEVLGVIAAGLSALIFW